MVYIFYIFIQQEQVDGDRYIGVITKVSTDNGANYSTRVENYASVYNSGNNTWGNVSIDILLDVTNYSNFKFYINHSSSGTITWLWRYK